MQSYAKYCGLSICSPNSLGYLWYNNTKRQQFNFLSILINARVIIKSTAFSSKETSLIYEYVIVG